MCFTESFLRGGLVPLEKCVVEWSEYFRVAVTDIWSVGQEFKILLSPGLLAYLYRIKKGQTEGDLRVRIDFIFHGIILVMEVSQSQWPHFLFRMRDLSKGRLLIITQYLHFSCITTVNNQGRLITHRTLPSLNQFTVPISRMLVQNYFYTNNKNWVIGPYIPTNQFSLFRYTQLSSGVWLHMESLRKTWEKKFPLKQWTGLNSCDYN